MEKKQFDYKPLACNKNERALKWDIKKDGEIPSSAIYVKMGDINSSLVRYIVMWGDGMDIDLLAKESPSLDFHSVSELMGDTLH